MDDLTRATEYAQEWVDNSNWPALQIEEKVASLAQVILTAILTEREKSADRCEQCQAVVTFTDDPEHPAYIWQSLHTGEKKVYCGDCGKVLFGDAAE